MSIVSTTAELSSRSKTVNVAAAAVVGLGTLGWIWFQRKSRSATGRKLRRNLSFTSSYLTLGQFPPFVKSPEPIIHACMYMDECPTDDDILELAIRPMLEYDRLAMIPCCDRAGTMRQPNPPLDPRKLVRRLTVNSTDQIYSTIQTLMNEPLGGENNQQQRGDLPWWEFVLLENKGTGDSACIWRVHHALGDGLSMCALMVRDVMKSSPDGAPLTNMSTFLPPTMMPQKSSSLEDNRTKFSWLTRVGQVLDCAHQVFTLPFTKFDDPTLFSQGCQPGMLHSGKRDIIILPTIPLKLIQNIKNAAHSTVNDVIFTCISQAIHDYLKEQRCPVLEEKGINLQCRALIAAALPRSMEESNHDELLQNKWFLLSSDMGIGCSPSNDILERLQYIHHNMHRLKTSPLAHVGMMIQNHILKYFPLSINQKGVHDSLSRHSMTVSNVPGPRQAVMIANREIKGGHMFFSCLSPQVSFVSYQGQVYGNMTADPDLVPKCQTIAKHYHHAMLSLAIRLKVPIPSDME